MDVNARAEPEDDPLGHHIVGAALAARLAAAGLTLAELAAHIIERIFGAPAEPPCALRHPLPGEAPTPVWLRKRSSCHYWLRRPTRRTAGNSSWAPARLGCPRHGRR
jgi:hypothetical protein